MSDQHVDRPRLRPGLAASPDTDPRYIIVYDQLRISHQPLRLTHQELQCVQMIDGRRTIAEIHSETLKAPGAAPLTIEQVQVLLRRFDEALFLENDRFRNFIDHPDREPSCIGCYPPQPGEIRKKLAKLFTASGGPGLPGEPGCRLASDGAVRAVLVPHMDYDRGGVTYGWGFKEIVERTDASLFVIIGTSHYSPERFTLTRKNFKTPLGTVPTDQAYIDRLVQHYGDGLFDDPFAHLPEHSIELEVVMLQYLLEGKRPFRIVPLLVGSFGDCVQTEASPGSSGDIERMVRALQNVEAEWTEPVCYVISGDLAHIGPKFQDPEPVNQLLLDESLKRDYEIINRAEQADPAGYFKVIAEEADRRRICGLPPTWTTLAAVKPRKGTLLHYGRYVHPQGFESVSFASMGFE